MLWYKVAGDPHHYGNGTVWPGKSHGDEMSAGPCEHSHYEPLSYCGEGRWERMGEDGGGMRRDNDRMEGRRNGDRRRRREQMQKKDRWARKRAKRPRKDRENKNKEMPQKEREDAKRQWK